MCEDIEYITPSFKIHRFGSEISERKVVYQVLKMTDSVMIFINEKGSMHLNSLYLAMFSPYDKKPIATRLFGDIFGEPVGNGMACRLSKRLEKPVYISCQLDDAQNLWPLIERRIYEEIRESPDHF